MPPVIKGILIINAAVFVLSLLVGPEFTRLFGLVPFQVVHHRWIWQPVTYLFMHGGAFHLLINLFVLWMFGMAIETQWGGREFLRFYLICGVGAGIFNVILTPHSMAPIVGASGAVYGLLVAFAMLYPDSVVYLYFLFPVKAKHMAIAIGVITFLSATGSGGSRVAHLAHLGGMLIGYIYLRWWWVLKVKAKSLLPGRGEGGPGPARRKPRPKNPGGGTKRTATLSPRDEMAEVDRILDKILEKGEGSLTDRERDILRRQARKRGEGHA